MQLSIKVHKHPAKKNWFELLKRPELQRIEVDQAVSETIAAVRRDGDAALKSLTERFSGVALGDLQVSQAELEAAKALVSEPLREAIHLAKKNIEKFHAAQQEQPQVIEPMPGVKCWRRSTPIEKVGLYIPTGSAPAISAVLMLGIPARIAGCSEIVLCTSPQQDGSVHPAILYAAQITGITKIFKIGGAQSIAAMAYGTETVPAVYKIFGSGNAYVMSAKHMVSREGIAIDLPAGVPEIMVVADETAQAPFVAADLLAQASHNEDSHVVLLSFDKDFAKEVIQQMETQLDKLPETEKATAVQSLKNACFLVLKQRQDALEIVNAYAPEHLVLNIKNASEFGQQVSNAGTVCLGNYSSATLGEYASGTNHALPAQGFAKAYGGLSIEDYAKRITFQNVNQEGFNSLAEAVSLLAEVEAHQARKNAIEVRK
jgi:histidinol dehydrogenase